MTQYSAMPDLSSLMQMFQGGAQGFGAGLPSGLPGMPQVSVSPEQWGRIQTEYAQEAAQLWTNGMTGHTEALQGIGADRRFAAKAWQASPVAGFAAAMYLLNARTLMKLADAVEADEKTKARIRFGVQQAVEASAPSNFLAFNADALQKAIDTRGESIARGAAQMLADIRRGHVSQTDESLFEVGRNVAVTPGQVVFENELFQLIEYTPTTAKVHQRPLLMVPPCINKYYILDLQPDNSLVRYALDQGIRTYMLSWRNVDESLSHLKWDDYIDNAVVKAIETVRAITGQTQINALGFCVGGTILATTLAVLAARKKNWVTSATFLTTLIDFTDTGILDLFVDEASVKLREQSIGPDSPGGPGLLKGSELASTFSFLRPNDLVWNYVVGNYLKGETPPPFDLLYWNSDSTNLPGAMYCWYLRNTYFENNLVKPGKTSVNGTPVDLGLIKIPCYFYGSREDHIVPVGGAYQSMRAINTDKRFVLGASGHIAGVINPPAKKKRNYWTNDRAVGARLPASQDAWLKGASEHPGSWWSDWSAWLKSQAGKIVAAPQQPGGGKFKPIEPAPGRYVKAKA
jgi:polyhydroxyalkanoate synthase subunit PhaC